MSDFDQKFNLFLTVANPKLSVPDPKLSVGFEAICGFQPFSFLILKKASHAVSQPRHRARPHSESRVTGRAVRCLQRKEPDQFLEPRRMDKRALQKRNKRLAGVGGKN
jgi:hypothetical protein